MLPDFTADGVLPPGEYVMTMSELKSSMLVSGRERVTDPNWDATWRAKLVDNATILVEQLFDIGLTEVYLDGSFVENKEHPGDIDGYFECPFDLKLSGELEKQLNLRDPHSVWTWQARDRQQSAGKWRLPMWIHYRVELYPHLTGGPRSVGSGIKDKFGNDLTFPSAFRQSRDFVQKGIVKVRP